MIYITIGGEEILSSVAEAEMIAKVNDHAALFVRGIVDNFYANKALDLLDKEIILYTMTGEKKEILFAGIISEVRLKVEGKLISADIRCTSYSVRFDSVKKQQAFQNTLLTYGEVLKELLSEKGDILMTEGKELRIESPLIQYLETDWEFIKRLARKMNTVVIPNLISNILPIAVGWVGGKTHVLNKIYDYEMTDSRQVFQINGKQKWPYIRTYKTDSKENFQLGDAMVLGHESMVIYEKKMIWKKGELDFSYGFGSRSIGQTGMQIESKLKGISLKGVVTQRLNEKLQVCLTVDSKAAAQNYEAHMFAYPYVPVSGNVMYSMPEKGTEVFVYFPNRCERYGVVRWCAHGSSYNLDVNIKHMRIPSGKGLYMGSSNMKMVNCEGDSLDFVDRNGIFINTKKKFKIWASKRINIWSRTAVWLTAQESLYLESKKQSDAVYMAGNEITFFSEKIISSGIPQEVNQGINIEHIGPQIKNPEQYALTLLGGLNQGEMSEIQRAVLAGIPIFKDLSEFKLGKIYAIERDSQ